MFFLLTLSFVRSQSLFSLFSLVTKKNPFSLTTNNQSHYFLTTNIRISSMRQRRTIRNGSYGGGGIVTMNGGGEISYWGERGGGYSGEEQGQTWTCNISGAKKFKHY
jgi:hypothetical protein